jgi:predicted anti-sigma-YlaC factor YlaD
VECTRCRELLSDLLDGRADAESAGAAEVHVATCAACRRHREELVALQRLVRLRPAAAVPDQTAVILARARPPLSGRFEWIRYALVAVALTQLMFALPGLVLGEDAGVPAHLARHAGSLGAALAIGMLYVAWRPERAIGLLPIAAALAACMAVTAVADIVTGRAGALGEGAHVLELVGLALVWAIAGAPRPSRRLLVPSGGASTG